MRRALHPDHAVVIGGSLTGLLAALTLTTSFANEMILDQDEPLSHRSHQAMPHTPQPHTLLNQGFQILTDLSPAIGWDFKRIGALCGGMTNASCLTVSGQRLARFRSGLSVLLASRSVIEPCVRQRGSALPKVRLLTGGQAQDLLVSPDRQLP